MKFPDLKGFRARHAGLIAVGFVAAVIFFVIGAGLRLLIGPVSLNPFSNRLQQALAEALPGVAVRFDSAALEWSRDDGRVDLMVLGARVMDNKGRIIAQAPKAVIGLVPDKLVHGEIVVQRIALVGMQLTLLRSREGVLRMGVSANAGQPDLLKLIDSAINSAGRNAPPLQSFSVRKARLAFYDQESGLFIVAPRADLTMASRGTDTLAALDADIEISGRRTRIVADLTLPANGRTAHGRVKITGLNLAALGRNAKVFSALKIVDLTLNLSADVNFSGTHLATVTFQAQGQGGITGWGLKGTVLNLGTLAADGSYDAGTGRYAITNASLVDGQVVSTLTSSGELRFDANNVLELASIETAVRDITLNMPGEFAHVVHIARVDFSGHYTPAAREAVLDKFAIAGGILRGSATGRLQFGEKSPAITLDANVNAFPVRQGLEIWPRSLADGARDWIDRNISAGSTGPFTIRVNIPEGALDEPALADGQLVVSFPITEATATYIKGLTPLTAVNGRGELNSDKFTATLDTGMIGPIKLVSGQALIPDLHKPSTVGIFTANLEGAMSDVLAVVDMPPLRYPSRFQISPADTGGTVKLDLSIKVPMLKDVRVEDIGMAIGGVTSGLNIALSKTARISDGAITFQITNNRLHAAGTASYGAAALQLDWTELFTAVNGITTTIDARTTLNAAARKSFGVDLDGLVDGAIPLHAKVQGFRGQPRHADITADLTPADLHINLINLHKPAGKAASADVALDFAESGTLAAADIRLSGPELSAAGEAQFDAAGSLAHLDIPAVKAGKANDFALVLNRGADAGLDLSIKGTSLDGTSLASGGKGTTKGPSKEQKFPGPFHIVAQLDRIALRDGVSLNNFRLDTSGVEDRLRTFTLSGKFARGPELSGAMQDKGSTRNLTLKTTDAGLLMKGVFGLDSIRGGKVSLAIDFPRSADQVPAKTEDDYTAILIAEDFRVMNQPFLTRLFSAGSLTGIIDLMSGQGIAVDKMTVPFTARDGSLRIRDARASGPAIGISADGYLDRNRNEIALRGTIAPVYGINSLLGVIPLVGDVLVSKKGEGVFGVTYSVSGNADEPHISVNPLAMLTPGILRRIFEGRIPIEKPQAPPVQTPPPDKSKQESPKPQPEAPQKK